MATLQENIANNIIKTHKALDELTLFIFRLDQVLSHIKILRYTSR